MKQINQTSGGGNLIGILFSISIGFSLLLFDAGSTAANNKKSLIPADFISYRNKVQQIFTSEIGVREKHPNSGPDVEKYLRYVNLGKGNPWCAAFVCWVYGQAGVGNPRSGWSPDLFGEGRVIWDRKAESGKLKAEANREESHFPKLIAQSQKKPRPDESETSPFHRSEDNMHPAWQLATGNWQPLLYPENPSLSNPRYLIPRTADIFGLFFPEKARIAHVGFIDTWDGTWLTTVEGNTNDSGSREGDGVYRKRRLIRSIYRVARYIN